MELRLKSIKVDGQHDDCWWGISGECGANAKNEVYFIAVVWDMSGAPPKVMPLSSDLIPEMRTVEDLAHEMSPGETIEFGEDGLLLWPMKQVVGGLNYQIVVVESDQKDRDSGKSISETVRSVQNQLNRAFTGLEYVASDLERDQDEARRKEEARLDKLEKEQAELRRQQQAAAAKNGTAPAPAQPVDLKPIADSVALMSPMRYLKIAEAAAIIPDIVAGVLKADGNEKMGVMQSSLKISRDEPARLEQKDGYATVVLDLSIGQ
jgi:hypothetical protein